MFSNKKRNATIPPMGPNPYPQYPSFSENFPPNNYDFNRLQTEINEIKRMQTELLNRISRLENYLGVRGELNSTL